MSTITNELEAIDAIAKFANGEGFEKKVVERLARYFKSMIFKSPVSGGVKEVVIYWVGFYVDAGTPDGKPHSKPDRIEFSNGDNMFGKKGNNRRQIQSAFVVPTLPVNLTAPALVKWTLDFKNPAAGPKVVITSQLQGCTFAIGIADDKYLMSHAQPEKDVSGVALAQAIHGRAQKFEGATTKSTFLIHPGNTIDGKSGFGYGDTLQGYKASVIGLVVKHTPLLGLAPKSKVTYSLSFIVVVIKNQNSIEKVVVVSHKDSDWKVEEITKYNTLDQAKLHQADKEFLKCLHNIPESAKISTVGVTYRTLYILGLEQFLLPYRDILVKKIEEGKRGRETTPEVIVDEVKERNVDMNRNS